MSGARYSNETDVWWKVAHWIDLKLLYGEMPWFWMILVFTKNRGSKKKFCIENSLQIFETPSKKTWPFMPWFRISAFRPLNINNGHLTTKRNTEKVNKLSIWLSNYIAIVFHFIYRPETEGSQTESQAAYSPQTLWYEHSKSSNSTWQEPGNGKKNPPASNFFFQTTSILIFIKTPWFKLAFRMYSNVKK